MYLVVGLGNPGSKYSLTRHNIGFMFCDYWIKSLNGTWNKEEHKAITTKFTFQVNNNTAKFDTPKKESVEVIVAKPQTFMNLSGESVQQLMNFYKIPKENLIVIHDEVDQPFGAMKFQHNRGHGGQNGVRNITELLGSPEYSRLRLGVGRPPHPDFSVGDYVLAPFNVDENKWLPQYLEKACDGVEMFLTEGLGKASSLFNGPVTFN